MGLTQKLGTIPLAVFTDSSNNVGIGAAASGSYKFQVTGTTNLTGALSGTSATFSGTVEAPLFFANAGGSLFLQSASDAISIRQNSTSNNLTIRFNRSGVDLWKIQTVPNGANEDFKIFNSQNSTNSLTIASTGAATFSGSATFGSDVFTYANGGIFFNGGGSYGSGIFQQSGGTLALQTGTTPRLQITSDGNVGIGTSSPTAKLDVASTYVSDTTSQTIFRDGTGVALNFGGTASGHKFLQAQDSSGISTYYNLLLNPRGGNVLIGTTGAFDTGVTATSTGQIGSTTTGALNMQFWNKATTGDNIFQSFYTEAGGGALRGTIDYFRAGGVVRYNTTSDSNLKNIIGDSDKQKSIDILNSTKIREYSWKNDETNKPQIGVIAQELYETFKGAVSKGSDDELFGTEDYKTWGVDKTAFTFHLIAGWQKHQELINDLQAQIEELRQIVATK